MLSERAHPDNALFQDAKGSMRQLPSGTFQNSDELDKGAAAVAQAAKQAGVSRIDHVVLSTRGDNLIVVQGNLQDPGRHLVSVAKASAVAQSLEQSTDRLAQHVAEHQESARAQARMDHMEHRNGLVVGMRP